MIELVKSPVIFRSEDHTYWLNGKQLSGITSSLIRRAFPDKYSNVPPEVLANAAEKGHALHELIEFHDNFSTDGNEYDDPRIASYDRLKKENGLTTIANEYLVSDEKSFASSIDIVMVNFLGEICLVDTKTTYVLDRLSTALQLSIYKRYFERQNPKLKVSHLYALWLPNKDHTIAEMPELQPVSEDILNALFEAQEKNEPFDIKKVYGNLPVKLQSVEDEIIRIEQQLKVFSQRREELRNGLYDIMEKHEIKSFAGNKIRLTRILPSTTDVFDSKRFKEEHPDLYNQYLKKSTRSGSLKITIS